MIIRFVIFSAKITISDFQSLACFRLILTYSSLFILLVLQDIATFSNAIPLTEEAPESIQMEGFRENHIANITEDEKQGVSIIADSRD